MENVSRENFNKILPSCSLTNDEMIARKAFLEKGLARKVNKIVELSYGYDLIFNESVEFSKELLDFINFERRCCSSFSYALIFEPHNKATHLQIYGSKQIKQELAEGFKTLGLINSENIETTKPLYRRLGLAAGLGLCLLCCALPAIGVLIGLSSLTAVSVYFERFGIFALGLAVIFFVYDFLKKRRLTHSCETSCDLNCDCRSKIDS
jgi:hypothetical protein